MPRGLSSIFVEEANKTEQSSIVHLITVELFKCTITGTPTLHDYLNKITVSDSSNIRVGLELVLVDTLTYIIYNRRVISIEGNLVTLNESLQSYNSIHNVSFTADIAIVDCNYDVEFNGEKYLRFPVKISEMTVSNDGSIDKASLAVANVSREITYYAEKYDGLRNRKVKVKTLFSKFLDHTYIVDADGNVTVGDNPNSDTTAFVEDTFIIDNYSYDENVCTFTLDPAIDLNVKIPRRRYMSDSCQWKYRDLDTCGYTGSDPAGENSCGKTLAACSARHNVKRFGGFPGITGNRRVWF